MQAHVASPTSAPPDVRLMPVHSNENALGPSPQAIAAYQAAARQLHRYPDAGAAGLRSALASRHGLEASRIVCGAGSDELIALLVRAFAGEGDEVLHSQHGFLMYALAARAAGAMPVAAPETALTADVAALLAAVTPRTRIVFLANPNNPTGTCLPAAELERLHRGLPSDVLLVIDAAYAEYVTRSDYAAGEALVEAHPNVVMLRTFSKIYGLAALRVGWAYCPGPVADVLNRIRCVYNVAAPAQAAAVAALSDTEWVRASRAHNERWRPWLTGRLQRAGLVVTPSVANFVLVHFDDADAAYERLFGAGVVARKLSVYGLANCLRITIGTEDEVRAVADALARPPGHA